MIRCRMCACPDVVRGPNAASGARFECRRCRYVYAERDPFDLADPACRRLGGSDARLLAPALARLRAASTLRVLDHGAGDGPLPDILRQLGHRVVAVDQTPPRRPHPDRLTGCLLGLHLAPASFDLAYALGTFERLEDPRAHLAELLRLTRPGGLVLLAAELDRPGIDEPIGNRCSRFRTETFEIVLAQSAHRLEWGDRYRVLIRVGAALPQPHNTLLSSRVG